MQVFLDNPAPFLFAALLLLAEWGEAVKRRRFREFLSGLDGSELGGLVMMESKRRRR
jgi:hypothetical protein